MLQSISKIFKIIGGCQEDILSKEIEDLEILVKNQKDQIDALQNNKIDEPVSSGKISFQEAYKLISHKLNMGQIYLSDDNFNLCSKDDAKRYTIETKVFARKWEKEDHDCDNFSFALMGYWSQGLKSFAFGIAWSNNHAFNIMIDDKKELYIIEPQTNEFMTLEEAKRRSSPDGLSYYPIRFVLC